MDAFDADVLIYAATDEHSLGGRVRVLFAAEPGSRARGRLGAAGPEDPRSAPMRNGHAEEITALASLVISTVASAAFSLLTHHLWPGNVPLTDTMYWCVAANSDVRDPAFLDVMLTVVTDQVKQQRTSSDQLNSRATAIAATAGAALALLATATRQAAQQAASIWAISIGSALFFMVLIVSYLLWRVRGWRMDPEPTAFWQHYRTEGVTAVKHQLVLNGLEAYRENDRNLNRKRRWLCLAVIVLLVQILFTTTCLIALPQLV